MIIIEEYQKEQYPVIWKNITEYKLQKYLENLYDIISKRLETQRYYKIKFSGTQIPPIKKAFRYSILTSGD